MTEQEIKELLEKYEKGLCSQEEQQLVEDFLQSFQQGASWHTGPGERRQMEGRILMKIKENIAEKQVRTKSLFRTPVLKYAAVFVLLLAALGIATYRLNQESPVAMITKTTPLGQKSRVVLTDGTTVRLNAGSSLIFPEEFTNNTREVTLTGEAFFEVIKNPDMPFIVRSGDLITTVLGTSFNIQAYPEQASIAVTVATGKVKVASFLDTSAVVLTKAEQAIYNTTDNSLQKKKVDLESFLAWKDGKILFDEITFSEAALMLERWFNVTITFENKALRNCLIRSKYNNENLANILESLKFIQGIDYRFADENTIIISGKACNTE